MSALSLLDYSMHVINSYLLNWDDKPGVLVPRCLRDKNVDQNVVYLSQSESASSVDQHGGGGRVGIARVHILRVWHQSTVPISWPRVVHCIAGRLPFPQHSVKLLAIVRPLSSVKRVFRATARP